MKFKVGDHVLLVDDAQIDGVEGLIVERARQEIISHLGGGIYDGIVFESTPPPKIITAAMEKIYWGGVVVIQNVVPKMDYNVIVGDPRMLVIQRPPAPPDWTKEYYLEFQPKGHVWNALTKSAHPSYAEKLLNIDVDWKDKKVVEIGCGRGEITRLIATAGVSIVYAVDKSPAAVALTREFCDDCSNVEVICQDARIWMPNDLVDVIVALDFVEHIDEADLHEMFKMWYSYLKEDSLVHISTPLGPDHVRDHKWAPSPIKLKDKMERVGFIEKRHVRPEGSRKFYAEFIK